jgi:hypothetical protein
MTDLLSPPQRAVGDDSGVAPQRPLAIGATIAGAASSVVVLLGCMAIGLIGWFASDAGSHGDTRDALRVGADAWLLAHGSQLQLEAATITAVPLGLTAFCAYVTFRLGRWSGATCAVDNLRTALTGALSLAGVYGVVAVGTGIVASLSAARPNLGLAFVGSFVLAVLAGGAGVVAGSGQWSGWRGGVPQFLLAVVTGAATVVLLMFAAGSLLVAMALLADFGAAANVLSRLHVDVSGGLLYTLLVATVAPNAALLGGSYLIGPGFVVGTGTFVSPSAVGLGPVPAFPLLAALPDEGAAPAWTTLLAAAPVFLAAVAAALMLRRFPVREYELGALRGLGAGVLGGILFTLAAFLAGGSVGPGRMSEVGPLLGQTLVAAVAAMGVGGLIGGLAMTWRVRHCVASRTESG